MVPILAILLGIVPEMALLVRLRLVSDCMPPTTAGIVPFSDEEAKFLLTERERERAASNRRQCE